MRGENLKLLDVTCSYSINTKLLHSK